MIAADTGSETSHLVSRPVTSYAVQATPQELALDPPPTVHSESAKVHAHTHTHSYSYMHA